MTLTVSNKNHETIDTYRRITRGTQNYVLHFAHSLETEI